MRAFLKTLIRQRDANPPDEPDTLRHVFYTMLPGIQSWAEETGIDIDHYDRTHKQNFGIAVYKALSSTLSKMVLDGQTSYEHLNIIETKRSKDETEKGDFPFELFYEKETVRLSLKPVKDGLNIGMYCLSGFDSTNCIEKMIERARSKNIKIGFIISDWDPSGLCLAEDVARRAKKLGIRTKFIRIGIRPSDIPAEHRTLSLVRIKHKDSRAKAFIQEYGTRCYEVDALSARELRELVLRRLIENGVDVGRSAQERFKEDQAFEARMITERLLFSLKKSVRRAAYEKILSYETRTPPTNEELIERILSAQQLVPNLSHNVVNRIAREVKELFHITDDDEEEQ